MRKQREYILDTARALSMFWIIAFWHLCDYLTKRHLTLSGYVITYAVLATFTFISGYFQKLNYHGWKSYFRKRIVRFYPVFFVACMLMWIGGGGIQSWHQLLMSLTGLSCFFLQQPPTLWYMCMLLVFYALTPLLIPRPGGCKFEMSLRCLLAYAFLLICSTMGDIDRRLLIYFPFYAAGLMTTSNQIERLENSTNVKITILFFIIILFNISFKPHGVLLIVISGIGLLALLSFSSLFNNLYVKEKTYKLINFVAYSSMCAYMFHRLVY